jgi:hypothetical protein
MRVQHTYSGRAQHQPTEEKISFLFDHKPVDRKRAATATVFRTKPHSRTFLISQQSVGDRPKTTSLAETIRTQPNQGRLLTPSPSHNKLYGKSPLARRPIPSAGQSSMKKGELEGQKNFDRNSSANFTKKEHDL